MPLYSYKCPVCHATVDQFFAIDDPERDRWEAGEMHHEVLAPNPTPHHVPIKRVYSFTAPADPIGDGYFDYGAGTYITSKRQLDEHNRVASAEATARLGIEHKFVSHDIRDLKAEDVGADDIGLGATHDAAVARGTVESKGKFTF